MTRVFIGYTTLINFIVPLVIWYSESLSHYVSITTQTQSSGVYHHVRLAQLENDHVRFTAGTFYSASV